MASLKIFSSFWLLIFVIFSFFTLSLQKDEESGGDINSWCQTTPHPNQCKYFLGRGQHHAPQHRADFRMLALQAAIDNANEAQGCAKDLGKMCQTTAKQAVWNDCYKLVNNTIFQLNQTLTGLKNNQISDFDAQTWLSAALTNLHTCFTGCVDLNVTDFVTPIKSSNLTEMISNSLAINHGFLKQNVTSDQTNDFPTWVTRLDRRLLATVSIQSIANVTVSQAEGSTFPTIQSALDYAESIDRQNQRFVIYIKSGVYNENIQIPYELNNIMFVGDGIRYTIITGNRSVAGGSTTYSSATVGIDGSGFIARGITFRNTAGPEGAQAVALRSSSDLSVFYACSIEGYQDTLFAVSQRQFYKLCYISGTVDFIFGNAAVVFQNCVLLVRRPLSGQTNTITAQGRGDPFQNSGISIHNCRVVPAPDLLPVVGSVQTYLGRPWQEFSRTVFLKTYMDGFVNPKGWLPWGNTDFAFTTLYYGEYDCFGNGSAIENRVNWLGYHNNMSLIEAQDFTVERLIAGRMWLPATGVPFIAGM
ncbi:pectinesterase, catalytic [Artemisia annua]|uniref:Pectinesterase n=1 Tax=Artemisia annua TaxID=35608 RepID=A0A2U1KBE8_ARTAN|nr:pectinesterase, catalytic [Artemisia annua]